MSDKIVNHFVLADGSVARYDYAGLLNAPDVSCVYETIEDVTNVILLNGFDKTDVTSGGYWNNSNGVEIYPNASYNACNRYASVKPNAKYSTWYISNTRELTASLYTPVCWYDENQNFISGEMNTSTNVFTAPEGARFARVSTSTDRNNTLVMCEGETYLGYNNYGYAIGSSDTELITENDISFFRDYVTEGSLDNGDIKENSGYYSIYKIISVPHDVTVKMFAGWEMHVFYYINGVQTSPHGGWFITEWTVPANTPFGVYFHKISGTSTLEDAKKAITVTGFDVVDYSQNGENPVYYYSGESIDINKHSAKATFKYIINYASLPSGGLQACDYYNGVLAVCRGDDILMLYNYENGAEIANLTADVGHGNAFQFGTTKVDDTDEFPVAYASPFFTDDQNNTTLVNKIRVSRTACELITSYKFPVSQCGYYGEGCVDDDESHMFMFGFKAQSYTTATNNSIVVSEWDLTNTTTNNDGTITPTFIKSFEIPFFPMLQGLKYVNGKIIVCVAPYDNGVFSSTIFVVDIAKELIVSKFESLPITVKGAELEDTFLVPNLRGNNLGILMANGRVQELTL